MKAMFAAFLAIVVLSVGAGYALNEYGPRSGVYSDNVREPVRH